MPKLLFDKLKLLRSIGLPTNAVQDAFLSSEARFKIFRAGRRVGKSFTAAEDVLPDVLTPGTRGWVVGPDYTLAEKEFRYIVDFLHKMHVKQGLPKPDKIRDNAKAGELYIHTPWGSEVWGKSADRPMSLVGDENDWIILSEAAQHDPNTWFRYLRPTLATRMGRAIFPTTPDIIGLWLYRIELQADLDHKAGIHDWEVFTQPAWDCPHYDVREIESARHDLPEDAFMEQYGGEWRFHTGRVFKAFQTNIHLINSFPVPRSWKTRFAVDYGARDATAAEFLACSPFGDFYFCDEHYRSELPTEVHTDYVKEIKRRYFTVAGYGDEHALGKQLLLDWGRHGVPLLATDVDRKARRDRFMAYLEPKEIRHPYHVREAELPAGKFPRLFIFGDKCPNLVREITFLRWRDGTRKEGNYGDTIGDDHAIDAGEYVLHRSTASDNRIMRRREPTNPVSSLTGY